MPLKRKLLKNSKLYLILDKEVNDYQRLLNITKMAVKGGIDIIQLRDKQGTAKEILKFSKDILTITKNKIPYIINDRVDIAISCKAAGVHLGQDDLPIQHARKMIGDKSIIGISCQTLDQARRAEKQGADYIGFGSVFQTLTKPDREAMNLNLLLKVITKIKIPIFSIGGINLDNLNILKDAGIRRVAVCRAICNAGNIEKVIASFNQKLQRSQLL